MTMKGTIHVLLLVRLTFFFSRNEMFNYITGYAYEVSIADSNRAREVTIKSPWTRGLALHPLGNAFQTPDDVTSLTSFDLVSVIHFVFCFSSNSDCGFLVGLCVRALRASHYRTCSIAVGLGGLASLLRSVHHRFDPFRLDQA